MSGDNDTRMKTWVQKWLDEFCVGAANGISAKEFARSDCTERKLRNIISNACKEGHPICSTPETGYFLPETSEEFEQTIAFLESRAMHSLATISTMRKGFNQYSQYGQTTFLTNPNQGV